MPRPWQLRVIYLLGTGQSRLRLARSTSSRPYQGLQELERTLADQASDAQLADGRDLALARRFVRIMAQWAGPDRGDRSRHMGQNL